MNFTCRVPGRLFLLSAMVLVFQLQLAAAPPEKPVTFDRVRGLEYENFLHPKLAQRRTVTFRNSTLGQLAEWLRKETELEIDFDQDGLRSGTISLDDAYEDRLIAAPISLLLERLRGSHRLYWWEEEGVVHLTTNLKSVTRNHDVADLVDENLSVDEIADFVMQTTDGPWKSLDGEGGHIRPRGTTLLVTNHLVCQRKVGEVLSALRIPIPTRNLSRHPFDVQLARRFRERVTVEFDSVPLANGMALLGDALRIDIRLDEDDFAAEDISLEMPIDLIANNQEVRQIFGSLNSDCDLEHFYADGIVWIFTKTTGCYAYESVLYNVSSLCDEGQSLENLAYKITDQTDGPWANLDGEGGDIRCYRDDLLLVRNTPSAQLEVQKFLESLRQSAKPSQQ